MSIAKEDEMNAWIKERDGIRKDLEDSVLKEQFSNQVKEAQKDMVVAPKHYADRKYQSILVIQDTLSSEEFQGYLKGSILKYQLRAGKKDKELQEHNKASVYLQWLKEFQEFGEMQNVPEFK